MTEHIRPQLRVRSGGCTRPRVLTFEEREALLRRGPVPPPRARREWVASVDYELIASHMHENVREAYIAKSEAWFAAHPPRPHAVPAAPSAIDTEGVAKLVAKWGARAPLDEWRKVGYDEATIERIHAKREWYRTHDEELQEEIERRWPGSSSARPKKVIKAVKKKMP